MDLREPARAFASPLAVPVLRALSRRSTPATAAQIARAARTGTLAGMQRACERLVLHGLLEKDEAGGRVVYALNFDHVLHDAAVVLIKTENALLQRLVTAFDGWEVEPVCAVLFGSAARDDGDPDSDIDLLLVRPRLTPSQRPVWARQVQALKRDVRRWTGNRLEVVDRTRVELGRLVRTGDPMVESWRDDGVTLFGEQDIGDLIEALS